MNNRVLIIDDEREICEIIRDHLIFEGFQVEIASNGSEGLVKLLTFKPDLIILDIMLEDSNGIDLCRDIRKNSSVPIIMLSARVSDSDKIICLGIGADDYVTKPFSPMVLVARIKAHLRRVKDIEKNNSTKTEMFFESLFMDKKSYVVKIDGEIIDLKAKEFEVLWLLAENKGTIFSKEKIFDAIWGYDNFGDMNTVTVHIRRLREKLEKDPSNPKYIKTVWGVGYKFQCEAGDGDL